MRIWDRLIDKRPPEEMTDDELFHDHADVLPPAEEAPTPASYDSTPTPAADANKVFTDIGLRYVVKDLRTGRERIELVDVYEREQERIAASAGVSPEQLLALQMENGTLRPDVFYLDQGRPVKPVGDQDLCNALIENYNWQQQPPEEEPAEGGSQAGEKPIGEKSLEELMEEMKRLQSVMNAKLAAEGSAPPPPAPPLGDEDDEDK